MIVKIEHLGEPGGGAWEERKWQGCPVDAVGSAKNLLILKITTMRMIVRILMVAVIRRGGNIITMVINDDSSSPY